MPTAIPRSPILWLLFATLALRVIHLEAPLIGVHSWRQADTAAVARNYFEHGFVFHKPQIDFGGMSPGYVDMEFPIYSFMIANAYRLTGVKEWWGRLLSALCWTALVAAMYDLAAWAAGRRVALWTAALVAFLPLNLYYGRVFMPEPMILASMASGLAFCRRWMESGRTWYLAASWLAITLACLLKIPSLYIGLPLAWLAWLRWGWGFSRRPVLWGYAMLVLLAVAGWYGYSHQLGKASGLSFGVFAYGSDKWGKWHLLLSWDYWNSIVFRSIAERHLTWAGLPFFLLGVFLRRRDRRENLFNAWLAAVLVYLLVVQGGNIAHEYYQLPVVVPMTFAMARGIDWLFQGTERRCMLARATGVVLVVAVGMLGAIRWLDYLGRENLATSREWQFARHIAAHTDQDERGVFLTDRNPTVLYLSHRKGWAAGDISADWVAERIDEGAAFLAGPAGAIQPSVLNMGEVVRSENGEFVIVRFVRSWVPAGNSWKAPQPVGR